MGYTRVRAQEKRQNSGQYANSWMPSSVVSASHRAEEGGDAHPTSQIVLGLQRTFLQWEGQKVPRTIICPGHVCQL